MSDWLTLGDLYINPNHIIAVDNSNDKYASISLSKEIVCNGEKTDVIKVTLLTGGGDDTPEALSLYKFLGYSG
jgi:hypothetical protein